MKSPIRIYLLVLSLSFFMTLSACGLSDSGGSVNTVNAQTPSSIDGNSEEVTTKLAPLKGFSGINIFAQQMNDSARIDRLESVVQNLHDTVKSYLPSINNLSEIEGEIQDLVGQLKTLVDEPAQPVNSFMPMEEDDFEPLAMAGLDETEERTTPPPEIIEVQPDDPPAATPNPASQPPLTSPPPSNTGGAVVDNIRVSEENGKTRIVFDSDRKVDYDVSYDAQEAIIIAVAKGAIVSANMSAAASKSKKISSITSTPQGSDTNIIFGLNGAARLVDGTMIAPNKDNSKYRYYFDIINQ